MLKINAISKKYGQHIALNKVSISVAKGSIFGLMGPNGAGKTSLIRILNQIIYPDSGDIFLEGEKLQPKHIQQIGYLPEERGLYTEMKVGEQCLYLAQLKGMSQKEAKKQLEYWFDKFEIQAWWHKRINELSKGMAQKIQFIVCVLHQPKLLIFDEPFSGFDPINADLIKKEILEFKKAGTTIILSTHQMESVEELCDDVALLHQSNKLLEGDVVAVKNKFKTNTFEIGILTNNTEGVLYDLSQKFTLAPANFKSMNNELKLSVQLGNFSTNDLLQTASQRGQITYFSEKIPRIHDIFIQTVTQHNHK